MGKSNQGKRAAIYARYSSAIQNDLSIEGQAAMCQRVAERENLSVVATFSDRAKSGATMMERDGLKAMQAAAKAGKFDVLVVDCLDRLARDQGDLPNIHKYLKFHGVPILTVHEGYATPMHIAIRGLQGTMYLVDLARNVRRGHNIAVSRDGRVPGSVAYGYRSVVNQKGVRIIDKEKAAIVRRIFRQYADGVSPRAIAKALSDDGVEPPRGAKAWSANTFIGGGLRLGMIGNPIYVGRIEWNRSFTLRDPESGKKLKRRAAPEELVTFQNDALRIVDQDLWDEANAVRIERGKRSIGGGRRFPNATPGGQHPLSGLLRCGVCNGPMRIAAVSRNRGPRAACIAGDRDTTCEHRRSYDMGMLLDVVLHAMRTGLIDPQQISEAVQGVHERWAQRQKGTRKVADDARRKLAQVEGQIKRTIDAITDVDGAPVKDLTARLKALQPEREALTARLAQAEAETNVVTFHPNAIADYKATVARLHALLVGKSGKGIEAAAVRDFRAMFQSIVVHPTANRAPYEISLYGHLGAIMGADLFPTAANKSSNRSDSACSDSANTEKSRLAKSYQAIIPLGRWKIAV